MRAFAVVDTSRRAAAPCAFLLYDEASASFRTLICEGVGESDLPLAFGPLARQGVRDLDHEQSMVFVEERIVPPSRQNLGQVLAAHGLTEYDPLVLLVASQGRCAQDDFELRELPAQALASQGAPAWDAAALEHAWVEYDGGARQGVPEAGALIATERRRLGWTQSELAERAGIQQATLSRLESGRTNPTVGLLADLARAMGKTLHLSLE